MTKATTYARWSWAVAIGLTVMWAAAPWAGAESKAVARAVRGEVVAVNVGDSPNVIVVTVMKGSKGESIVGATVGADTKIMRGKQKVGLDALKVGESVELTYVKQDDGLVARSIHAR